MGVKRVESGINKLNSVMNVKTFPSIHTAIMKRIRELP